MSLLQPGDVSVQLVASMVACGSLVAAHGVLQFLLRLINLAQLLPDLRLLFISQEKLDAGVYPF